MLAMIRDSAGPQLRQDFRISMLENAKKNDENGGESVTRLSGTEGGGNRAVIGSRDGNSRNYAVKDSKGSGQD